MGWFVLFYEGVKLIFLCREDGSWLYIDLINGWGYVEVNVWQVIFGLLYDILGLVSKMGGNDILCVMLNDVFEKVMVMDFVFGYGGGYVSYVN